MSTRRRVTLAVVWAAAGRWGRETIGFAIFLILARLLGPEAYGLVGMATVVIAFAQVCVTDLVQDPLVQREDLEPGHLDAAFWLVCALAIALVLAVFACAEPLAKVFDEPDVAPLVRWLSVLPILYALSAVPTALLRRQMRFGVLATRSLLSVVAGGAVGIGMALAGKGAFSLVGYLFTQNVANVVVLWTASDWRPGSRLTRRHVRDLQASGFYMLATRLTGILQNQTPRVLIGYFLGPVALGLYTVSARVVEIMYLLAIRPLTDVTLPVFARAQGDIDRFRQMLSSARRLSALVALPVSIGLALTAPELVPTLFGDQWQAAAPVVQILALQGIVASIGSVGRVAVLQGLGRWDLTLVVRLLATALTIAAIIPVVHAGLAAVAAAVVLATYALVPIDFFLVRRLTGTSFTAQARTYVPLACAALVMAALVLGWRQLMVGRLIDPALLASSVLLGAATYTGVLLLIAQPLVRETWQLVTGIRGSRRGGGFPDRAPLST